METDRSGEYIECEECGEAFYVYPSRVKQAKENGHTIRYCSTECYNQNKDGENNPFHGKRHSDESIGKMNSHPNRYNFPEGDDNPNYDDWNASREEKRERFLKYHKEGYRDKKMADKLDISEGTAYRWRRELGLEANGKTKGDSVRYHREDLIANVGECQRCGWDENKFVLEVHHRDRDSDNNERENLELLCPNCHQIEHYTQEDGPWGQV